MILRWIFLLFHYISPFSAFTFHLFVSSFVPCMSLSNCPWYFYHTNQSFFFLHISIYLIIRRFLLPFFICFDIPSLWSFLAPSFNPSLHVPSHSFISTSRLQSLTSTFLFLSLPPSTSLYLLLSLPPSISLYLSLSLPPSLHLSPPFPLSFPPSISLSLLLRLYIPQPSSPFRWPALTL